MKASIKNCNSSSLILDDKRNRVLTEQALKEGLRPQPLKFITRGRDTNWFDRVSLPKKKRDRITLQGKPEITQEQSKRITDTYIQELEKQLKERTAELALSQLRLREANKRATTVKHTEVQLTETLQKEKELSQLKSNFVSMASHEFRTPLSSILSSASLIKLYLEKGMTRKCLRHVQRIKASVCNMTTILNDFLSLEKLESEKVQLLRSDLDFNNFISEIFEEVAPYTKNEFQVKHRHFGSPHVNFDQNLVKNILLNLLSNALKYSPEGTDVHLISENKEGQLFIKVKDEGIGIPEEEQANMFSRFFRASNVLDIDGNGLGLTIVKRYLDLMNGTISFTSKEGGGTTFKVAIPIA